MRRMILVPFLVVVAVLAIAGAVGWYFYNNYQYYSTDDAQVTGQLLNVSSPQNGQLTNLAVKLGDKVTTGQVIGTVSGISATGAKTSINVTSPIDGTIVQNSAVQGQAVAAGYTLVAVANIANPTVTAYVDEGQLNNIKVGQDVDVTVDAFSGTTYSGHVQQIVQATAGSFSLIPSTDNATGNFTKVSQRIPVIVSIDGTSGNDLLPGLNATVKIHLH